MTRTPSRGDPRGRASMVLAVGIALALPALVWQRVHDDGGSLADDWLVDPCPSELFKGLLAIGVAAAVVTLACVVLAQPVLASRLRVQAPSARRSLTWGVAIAVWVGFAVYWAAASSSSCAP